MIVNARQNQRRLFSLQKAVVRTTECEKILRTAQEHQYSPSCGRFLIQKRRTSISRACSQAELAKADDIVESISKRGDTSDLSIWTLNLTFFVITRKLGSCSARGICLEATDNLLQKPYHSCSPVDDRDCGHQRPSVDELAEQSAYSTPELGRLPLDAWGVSGFCHLPSPCSPRQNCRGAFEQGSSRTEGLLSSPASI